MENAAKNNNVGSKITPVDKLTPVRKRKAEEEGGKRAETKKLKPTYTPRTPTGRQLRKGNMAEKKDTRPVVMHELKDCLGDMAIKLSDSLTKSLTAGLTKDFTEAVSVVAGTVATNTKNIEAINGTIKRIEAESVSSASKLEQKIERLESVVLASKNGSGNTSRQTSQQANDLLQVDLRVREENIAKSDRYSVARRSLRIWPVRGDNDDEVRAAAVRFLREKMSIDALDVPDECIYRVRRSKPPRKLRVKWEAIVTFEDKYARDTVAAHGKNLADFIDEQGLPTAGTRIDYPSHLGTTFRALDWYGKEMKERHGRGTKRNMKFDDNEETLVLDVCLPGCDVRHRVSVDEARRFKSEVDRERTESSRKCLEALPIGSQNHGIFSGLRTTGNYMPGSSVAGPSGYTSPKRRI